MTKNNNKKRDCAHCELRATERDLRWFEPAL